MIPIKEHFPSGHVAIVHYPKASFSTYAIAEKDGNHYITGIPTGRSLSEVLESSYSSYDFFPTITNTNSEFGTCSSIDALIEFLSLAHLVFHKHKLCIEEVSPLGDIDIIVTNPAAFAEAIFPYVQKYGIFTAGFTVFEPLRPGEAVSNHILGRDLTGFAYGLSSLFEIFLCWCYLEWGESIEVFPRLHKYLANESPMSMEAACRRIIAGEAEGTEVVLYYTYMGNALRPEAHANSFINALCYQMLGLVSLGEAAHDGLVVSTCKQCGKQYMKKHGNSALCEECRNPREKSRAFRNRERIKKEAESHAQ